MRCLLYIMPALFIVLLSCSDKEAPREFYPVHAWLEEELHHIDSNALAVQQISGDSADSIIITAKTFREITKGLLELDFSDRKIRDMFSEEVLDEGFDTNISIIYAADPEAAHPLRRIQLNLKPGSSHPKSLYAERTDVAGDMIIKRKIIFNSRTSMIVGSAYYRDNKLVREASEKFVWGTR